MTLPGAAPRWPAALRGPAAVAAAAAVAVAGLGGAATEIGPWYFALRKPSWQPPDWLFGPVWTLIYGLTAWAAVKAWRAAPDRRARRRVLALFTINAVLNVAWSVLFFHLRRPDWALVETVPFLASIAALIAVLWPLSRPGAWLLLPYLAWVAFASWLNLAVVRLNAPFGA